MVPTAKSAGGASSGVKTSDPRGGGGYSSSSNYNSGAEPPNLGSVSS